MGTIKTLADHFRLNSSNTNAPVLFEYQRNVCTAALNRPKAHNALDLEMVRTLRSELDKWNETPSVKAIIFKKSSDKAFCAGADLLRLFTSKKNPPDDYHYKFFKEQYALDLLLAQMKPVLITLWDQLVVGGGVGMSIHAPIKIATEYSVFGMPEAKIGAVGDVGSGYFLPKLKKHLGYFLVLTGTNLKGKELVQAGVADHFVKRENLHKLEQEIIENTGPNTTVQDLRNIISKYEEVIDKTYPNEDLIDDLFGKDSLVQIYNAVKESNVNTKFTQKVAETMDRMCPKSLRVIFEQLQRGKNLSYKENLKMDMRVMMRSLDGHDAIEGIRCVLVDKGSKPQWSHKSIFEFKQGELERYFEKLENDKEILEY